MRSTPACSKCGSDDIVCHATTQWSNESQEWQLTGTFGQPAYCNDCNGSCYIGWLALNRCGVGGSGLSAPHLCAGCRTCTAYYVARFRMVPQSA
jgi:hypothetical protein